VIAKKSRCDSKSGTKSTDFINIFVKIFGFFFQEFNSKNLLFYFIATITSAAVSMGYRHMEK